MLKLLALFIVLPLLDLWLLSALAGDSFLGFGFAVGLVISTGLIGASLAKRQGLTAWRNFNRESGQGVLPADAMLDGVLILLAGAVLITPGLITDVVGLALLMPPIRFLIRRRLVKKLVSRIDIRQVGPTARTHQDATVIDAEFQRRENDVESDRR